MKKHLLLLIAFITVLSSCKKYDVNKQNAADDAAIQAYLKANNISALKDESGLYYQILTAGGNTHPSLTSAISVGYVGSELDGSVFDQAGSTTLFLNDVIKGWQIGIPKIGIGGEIKLFVPSSLGYGNQAAGIIKANTVLVFDIRLFGFNG